MPFHTRPHFGFDSFSGYAEKTFKEGADGMCSEHISFVHPKLPECSNFDFDKLVKAGINLETKSTIIKDSSVNVDNLMELEQINNKE